MSEKRLPTINRIFIVGNLTRDPELRETTSGVPVVNFRIAANRRYRDSQGTQKEETCFVGVVAWASLAEACADYLYKGSAVYVEGELQSRNWETTDGQKRTMVEIHAHRVQFLDKKEYQEPEATYDEHIPEGDNPERGTESDLSQGDSDPEPKDC